MQICSRQICAGAEDREANPGYMDVFKFAIHGIGYPLPGGYDELLAYLCITMREARRSWLTLFGVLIAISNNSRACRARQMMKGIAL